MTSVKIPDNQGAKIIPIAEELLEERISDTKKIRDQETGDLYKVLDWYTMEKSDEIYMRGLMFLATGRDISYDKLWSKYKNSSSIYMVICLPEKQSTTECPHCQSTKVKIRTVQYGNCEECNKTWEI